MRPEDKTIWQIDKADVAKLAACPGPHDFEDATPERMLAKTYRCRKCGGELPSIEHYWYERGLAHGRTENASKIAEFEEQVALAQRGDPLVDGIARSELGRE